MRFDYIMSALLSFCGFFFRPLDIENLFFFFGAFQSFFIDGYSAVRYDFGVLMKRGELRVLLLCHLVSNPS